MKIKQEEAVILSKEDYLIFRKAWELLDMIYNETADESKLQKMAWKSWSIFADLICNEYIKEEEKEN